MTTTKPTRVHVVNQPIAVVCPFNANLTLSNHRYAVLEGGAYTVVFNLSGEPHTHDTTLTYAFEDNPEISYHDFEDTLGTIVDRVHECLEHDHNVLVHCRAGINRSAAVVVAYALKYRGLKLRAAVKYIEQAKQQRYRNWPTLTNQTFKQHLQTWQTAHTAQ
jgi:protein-tyrosine phosphatase